MATKDLYDLIKHWLGTKMRAVSASIAMVFVVVSLSFGVDPWTAIKHGAWYALGDVDSVPVWVHTMSPFTNGSPPTTPVGLGSVERIESWGVSSRDARQIMYDHNVLTDWWRKEVTRIVEDDLDLDDPLLSTYPGAMGLITHEVFQLIPDKILTDRLLDDGIPGTLRATGCPPSTSISVGDVLIYYNVAPRRACDNVIGGVLWLFVATVGATLFGFVKSVFRRNPSP